MKYEEVFKDWEYLWDIGVPNDMTGGYVDQRDLDKLLRNPSKKTAKDCLIHQMEYWFQVGLESPYGGTKDVDEIIQSDSKVAEIKQKYGF